MTRTQAIPQPFFIGLLLFAEKALESHGPISGNSYVCLRPPPSFHFMRPDTARSSSLAWARKFLFGFLRKFGGEYSIWQPSACQHSPVCELFS